MKISLFKPLLTTIVISSIAALSSFGQAFLTNDLVAYYPFNGNANDGSGNGYDGAASSNCWFIADRFGNPNHAIFITNILSGAESDPGRIDIPAAALNTLASGTISAWIYPNNISSGVIIAKQHDGLNTYASFTIGGYYDSINTQYVVGNPGTLYFAPKNLRPLLPARLVSPRKLGSKSWWYSQMVHAHSIWMEYYAAPMPAISACLMIQIRPQQASVAYSVGE